MPVQTVALFLALLAVAAEGAVVANIGLLVAGTAVDAVRELRGSVVDAVGPQAFALAAMVAGVCTAGSLYFSEVAHFTPCRLCWFQRGCMYPLVVLLAVAAWRRSRGLAAVGMGLAGLGAAVAGYHRLLESYPNLESDVCDPRNPCTSKFVEELGYLTIPTMALSGFALVLTLLAIGRRHLADVAHHTDRPAPTA